MVHCHKRLTRPQKSQKSRTSDDLEIKSEYRINGFNFKLLMRQGVVALYGDVNRGNYEIIIIRRYKADKTFPSGSVIKKGQEYLPSPHDWGQYAWSMTSREGAERVFNETCDKFNRGSPRNIALSTF